MPAGTEMVPSGLRVFIQSGEFRRARWVLKYFRRVVIYLLYGRLLGLAPELDKIPADAQRILWINLAAPSLGDSLMDLAPRRLLSRLSIVLLTDPLNAPLYKEDSYFKAVFTSHDELKQEYKEGQFDCVICDSFSSRTILAKLKTAPLSPFVSLYRFTNGFEVHRTRFAYERIASLLDQSVKVEDQLLHLGGVRKSCQKRFDVCVAVGGKWAFRTYARWMEVIQPLVSAGLSVHLVGSDNGVDEARRLTSLFPSISSSVGVSSLEQVMVEISSARIFVGCDGGLWHIASAYSIPSVALFADCQIFSADGRQRVLRNMPFQECECLYAEESVSDIRPEVVIDKIKQLANRCQVGKFVVSG